MVQIQGYKVNKLHMENTVANGTELQLQNQVKYNVNYMDDVHKCVGILSFRITDGNMNPFEVQNGLVTYIGLPILYIFVTSPSSAIVWQCYRRNMSVPRRTL